METVEGEDPYIWMDPIESKKSSRSDRKRRFSEEQVKSLDSMFESQTKLEPRKKLQLAKELGLHPRQVAIWFQNKRARWKSKQLEREYDALRADYDSLLSSFESLKNEKQILTKQLEKLAELLEMKPMEEGREDSDSKIRGKMEQRSRLSSTEKSDVRIAMCSDDEEKKHSKFSKKEADLHIEPLSRSSWVSAEQQQFDFQHNWPSDQSCASSQWWEFWPVNE